MKLDSQVEILAAFSVRRVHQTSCISYEITLISDLLHIWGGGGNLEIQKVRNPDNFPNLDDFQVWHPGKLES